MKRLAFLLLLIVVGLMTSCTSEYEERLSEGLSLKARLAIMEQNQAMMSNEYLSSEILEIRNEINLLARISGHEELFLQQVYSD